MSSSFFYSRPSYLSGAGAIYSGARRQRGGSVFGALKSIVTPLISGIGRSLKKNVVNNAIGFASDVVGDITSGKNVKQSLLNRGKQRSLQTLKQTFTKPTTRKPKRISRRRRRQRGSGKRRLSAHKKPSRKRRASKKHSTASKRRRCNF